VVTQAGVNRNELGGSANAETIEAWDGPLYDRFVQFRDVLVAGLGMHGEEALRLVPPRSGDRVLDIGCGFGDTTQHIAQLVGERGEALGVDASATEEARQAGISNARFMVADVEKMTFEETFEMAFSRMGTMFFANPVAAMRNVRSALAPGGRLTMVVWRAKEENEWMYRPQLITERFVTKPEDYDEPTCGPGPFSMANADTTSGILLAAGFKAISLRRCDLPMRMNSVDEAVELVMTLGPAGEILRLAGDRAAHLHEPVAAAIREEITQWAGPEGFWAPTSTWIVTAVAPAG